ncbi:MAG TPA: F390 synthetase-related protein [Gemmatimonadaceae bacterium]|nr:F390 synthetase-related protein [Gemmatimonadaceae bacterium]
MRDLSRIAGTFARARWGYRFDDRTALLAWQRRQIDSFLRAHLPNAAFYRGYRGAVLSDLPIVDKTTVLGDFAAFNVRGITLDRALSVALAAERSRDFRPTIDGVTVGMSSGTSGTRGVFVVSPAERAQWVGLTLARVLNGASLRRLLNPTALPLRVAFFLRANSNLYETLASRRLRFAFHDLVEPMDAHIRRLDEQSPDILVAPPTVLRQLAEAVLNGELSIGPSQVVSVAEVLEPDDRVVIQSAFNAPVQEIYQATEGFLGASCSAGRVHLNEEFVHIEPEWLDAERRRFRPLVTDFSRTTQLIVRYRLDDILLEAGEPCPCGRVTRSLEAIEGRADDVLWRPSTASGVDVPVFPDVIRRSMALAASLVRDYRIEQHGDAWHIRLDVAATNGDDPSLIVRRELEDLFRRLAIQPPSLVFEPWRTSLLLDKRRRIRCVERRAPAAALV